MVKYVPDWSVGSARDPSGIGRRRRYWPTRYASAASPTLRSIGWRDTMEEWLGALQAPHLPGVWPQASKGPGRLVGCPSGQFTVRGQGPLPLDQREALRKQLQRTRKKAVKLRVEDVGGKKMAWQEHFEMVRVPIGDGRGAVWVTAGQSRLHLRAEP